MPPMVSLMYYSMDNEKDERRVELFVLHDGI